MEHVENTPTAEIMDGMVVEQDEPQEETLAIESAAESLAAEAGEGGETGESGGAQEEEEAQQDEAAQDQTAAIRTGVRQLFESGWTGEQLMTFSNDERVRADIADGKSVADAAMAYLRRLAFAAPKQKSAASPVRETKKRGVPAIRAGANGPVRESTSIEDMDDEAFARFSRRAQDLARSGKKVLIK